MLTLWITACTPLSVGDSEVTHAPWNDPAVEVITESPDPADWIFTNQRVHQVEIQVDTTGIGALWASPYEYVQGEASFDGQPLGAVGVRLKGKIGSFRDLDHKSGFKIDINHFDPENRLAGLEQLTLNNAINDCSFMKENVAYEVYRAAGVPTPRTGYAWVTLNGEPYGLYTLVETPDDRFLGRVFEEPDGNLYDGKYVWYGGSNYVLLDFHPSLAPYFELEEGTLQEGNADLQAIIDQVDAAVGTLDYYEDTQGVIDWDQQHRFMAAEQWVGHIDGYSMNTNNYRLYVDPARDGRVVWVPWDIDHGFTYDYQWGKSWDAPQGRVSYWCMYSEACREQTGLASAWLVEQVDERVLLDRIEQNEDLIRPYIDEDPRRECSAGDFPS